MILVAVRLTLLFCQFSIFGSDDDYVKDYIVRHYLRFLFLPASYTVDMLRAADFPHCRYHRYFLTDYQIQYHSLQYVNIHFVIHKHIITTVEIIAAIILGHVSLFFSPIWCVIMTFVGRTEKKKLK
jgi:hypothetical protein